MDEVVRPGQIPVATGDEVGALVVGVKNLARPVTVKDKAAQFAVVRAKLADLILVVRHIGGPIGAIRRMSPIDKRSE